jgi:sugar fermentation stimulation protein A
VRFVAPLLEGRLVRRRQRFLADVELAGGRTATAHCPNTGSMLGCQAPGSRVFLSQSASPGRRYPLTWELVEAPGGTLVGINTARTNRLVAEALDDGVVAELRGCSGRRAEVPVPGGEGRLDFLLERPGAAPYYLEVKNVTAAVEQGLARFPDAVSERATRHVRTLAALRSRGYGAGLLFCVQRADVQAVAPADAIDPAYGAALREAAAAGVDVLAYGADVTPAEIVVRRPLPVRL